MNNRRHFIKSAALTAAASLTIPEIVSAAATAPSAKKVALKPNDIILFQGDSITDWGRDRNKAIPNDFGALGTGYSYLSAAELLCKYPSYQLHVYNRGVGGNKVYQLAERWDADCLALKPTVLSIMIGVNDYWHTLTGGYKGTIDTYRTDYRKLLDRTQQALPGIRLIIGEPFAIKGVKAVDEKWYPAFDSYRQVSREVAKEYGAAFIPYQSIMDKAIEDAPAAYWSLDGVHPSVAGAKLMSQAWMETVK
ncbi:SGNH/GDSL hydrolase family protein [Mucilaginibacter koreensis]